MPFELPRSSTGVLAFARDGFNVQCFEDNSSSTRKFEGTKFAIG
jgi:hypothetical protein